jgi:hypothetical protein
VAHAQEEAEGDDGENGEHDPIIVPRFHGSTVPGFKGSRVQRFAGSRVDAYL